MLVGLGLGFILGFCLGQVLFISYMESDLEEKKKLWGLEEDKAREARGEPIIPKSGF